MQRLHHLRLSLTGSLSLTTLLLLISVKCSTALKLNLTESCFGTQLYFCSLPNLTASIDDPLVIVDAQQPQLTELSLRDSLLRRLPADIFSQAINLRSFIAHNCGVNRLSGSDFAQAQHLRRLVLQRNRLFDVPEKVFSALLELESLHLGHNTIRLVHRSAFAGLGHLQYLDMQANDIHSLPDGLFTDLINLEHVDLSDNEIEKIDSQTFATNTKLQSLLLAGNKFSVFESNALEHLPHLHLLDISNAAVDELRLQSVDTLLARSSGLQRCVIQGGTVKMHASNNRLKSISIGDKLAVREIELHGNMLDSLEDFVGMTNLQHLDVSKNDIRSLQTSHSPMYLPLPSLTSLNLASNHLSNLSIEQFILLPKLTHLDLAFNYVRQLDEEVFEPLENLEKFYIEGNGLHRFDFERFLLRHTYLKEIGLYDNDFDHRSLRKTIAHLKDRHIQIPVRFGSSSISSPSGSSAIPPASSTVSHHLYASSMVPADVQPLPDLSGSSSIHPYWTTRDIFALITLLFVLLILVLQLFRILQEEQWLCWRPRERRTTAGDPRNDGRPLRLAEEEEDDSEV